ncbi:SDR family NAD(P)-dependent oxidoreductase [Poseidonibacter sp.]|uniref:SDR family NAD(P)-dependent oxidoreductase n=1 Tax=Poseidonibacter sp. TaxID=2321188 RepID=UPI00359D0840
MKNILITGCSTGIGLETALALKYHGYKVYASARKDEDIKKLEDLGFHTFKIDVTKKDDISNAFKTILKNDKTLDAVFNNAGYGQPGAVEDITTDVLREQFETNLFGLHEVTLQAMKIFRKQGFGKIAQHSSVLGIISLKFRGAYNASKYAIEGLNDTLRQEVLGSNIFISTINTGPVTSKFRANALKKFNEHIDIRNSHFSDIYINELKKRLETNDDKAPFNLPASSVANVVLQIMKSKKPKPRYYVTKATHLLGFFKRILPTSIMDKLLNRI